MKLVYAFIFCLCGILPAFADEAAYASRSADSASMTGGGGKQNKAKNRKPLASVAENELQRFSPNFYKQDGKGGTTSIIRSGDQPRYTGPDPSAAFNSFSTDAVKQNPFHDDAMYTPLSGYTHNGPLTQKFSYEAIRNGKALEVINLRSLLKQKPDESAYEYDNVYN